MKRYRLVVTGPSYYLRYSVQKKTIFGWREVEWSCFEERAQAYMDELVNGPKVIREVEVL